MQTTAHYISVMRRFLIHSRSGATRGGLAKGPEDFSCFKGGLGGPAPDANR